MEEFVHKFSNVGVYVIAQVVAFPVVYWLTPRCVEDRRTLTNDIVLMFILPVMLYSSASAAYKFSGSIELRWSGVDADPLRCLEIYVAHQVFSCVVDFAFPRQSWRHNVGLMAHHATTIACGVKQIYTGAMPFWASLSILAEFSTPSLKIVNMGTSKGGDFAERFKARLGPLWLANGLLLWATYIIFRLVLFPVWLCWFFYDLHRMEDAMRSKLKLTYFEVYVMPATVVLLLALSSMWFQRIHAGVAKALKKFFRRGRES
mmetsp:Transcript_37055/g.104555  ORF Transcript_37055/g.104555 Transcript_37055/m.104555 type:complete len:260 (+) Transcript_37055:47-826(+)